MSKRMDVKVEEIGLTVSFEPLVSVCMVTYNHERFITQAVESVMMQETDFPIELVVGEDCSTDNTREILLELQKRYSDRIRLLLPERNLGPHKNFRSNIKASRGKYVAFMDGDDFWTDPLKLAKQVALMETEAAVRICFHPVSIVDETGMPSGRLYPISSHRRIRGGLKDLLDSIACHSAIPTGSVVMLRAVIPEVPENFDKLLIGDCPYWVMALGSGIVACIDEPMTAYRQHDGGIWSSKTQETQFEAELEFWRAIAPYIPKGLRGIGWGRMRDCCEKWFSMVPSASRMKMLRIAFSWITVSLQLGKWNGAQFRYFIGRIFPMLPKLFRRGTNTP